MVPVPARNPRCNIITSVFRWVPNTRSVHNWLYFPKSITRAFIFPAKTKTKPPSNGPKRKKKRGLRVFRRAKPFKDGFFHLITNVSNVRTSPKSNVWLSHETIRFIVYSNYFQHRTIIPVDWQHRRTSVLNVRSRRKRRTVGQFYLRQTLIRFHSSNETRATNNVVSELETLVKSR